MTKISYLSKETNIVSNKVFNVLGREVSTRLNDELKAGEYNVQFYADSLTSGVYFAQLKAGTTT